jgi:hypothetical protein
MAPAAGAYALIPPADRPAAFSFEGVSGRGNPTSVSAARGRVVLVGFDLAGAPAPKPQLNVLRQVYLDLRPQRVRMLRVTLTGEDLRALRVAIQGHVITYPVGPTADLAVQVYRYAEAGIAYSLLIDRQGRVAARLIGTSDPQRLEQTVQALVRSGD